MKNAKRKWEFLMTRGQKDKAIDEIITYFKNENDQEIGVIAAEDYLDFMLDTIGGTIYNKAIEDSKVVMREGMESIDINISSLLR